jgi:hypothetical protein
LLAGSLATKSEFNPDLWHEFQRERGSEMNEAAPL